MSGKSEGAACSVGVVHQTRNPEFVWAQWSKAARVDDAQRFGK